MAFKSVSTTGTRDNIDENIETLMGTITVAANTTPQLALLATASDNITAVVLYEE